MPAVGVGVGLTYLRRPAAVALDPAFAYLGGAEVVGNVKTVNVPTGAASGVERHLICLAGQFQGGSEPVMATIGGVAINTLITHVNPVFNFDQSQWGWVDFARGGDKAFVLTFGSTVYRWGVALYQCRGFDPAAGAQVSGREGDLAALTTYDGGIVVAGGVSRASGEPGFSDLTEDENVSLDGTFFNTYASAEGTDDSGLTLTVTGNAGRTSVCAVSAPLA